MTKVATVKYSSEKTCFISIPKSWDLCPHYEQHVFEVTKDNVVAYLSWSGKKNNLVGDVIEINRKYCSCLGFTENDEVSVKEVTETVLNCEEAVLRPPNADGFEVIDLNKEEIELQLMKQIRVIWKTQVFPLWIKNIEVLVEISSTSPCQFALKLVEETSLIIKDVNDTIGDTANNNLTDPVVHTKHKSGNYLEKSKLSSFTFGVMNTLRNALFWSSEVENIDYSSSQDDYSEFVSEVPVNIALRVNPIEEHLFTTGCTSHFGVVSKLKGGKYPSAIYVSSSVLPDDGKDIPEIFLAEVSKLLSSSEKRENKENKKSIGSGGAPHEKRKYASSTKERLTKTGSLNDERHFSSSIVQVIVLTEFERSCSSCIVEELNISLESGSALVSDCLRKMLGLEVGSHIILQSITHMPSTLAALHLYPVLTVEKSLSENIKSLFLLWLKTIHDELLPLIFCNGTIVTIPVQDRLVDFVLKASSSQYSGSPSNHSSEKDKCRAYWNISPLALSENVTFRLESVFPSVKVNGMNLPIPSLCLIDNHPAAPSIVSLGGIDDAFKKGLQFLELWLNISPISKSLIPAKQHNVTLLICGPKGGGKTTLCQALSRKISQSPYYVYCHFISCQTMKGRRGETLWKNWQKAYLDAIHREPSLLVVDDLDAVAGAPTTPEEEVSMNGIHSQKIVHAFLNLCDRIKSSGAKVVVIATARSLQSIHPSLTSTRGDHVFQHKIEINCPTKGQREEILKALIESKLNVELSDLGILSHLASKTEGYVARDLDNLVNRATHAAWMRRDLIQSPTSHASNEVCLTEADFSAAFENFIPSSLQSVHLHKIGNKQWCDVGGLSEVKETLQKILLWPAKYPTLFASCPLRLQSGILLYGPPGTGKTLIAGIVAKESGLNFIHIKGPELLSKYIGASEQALRNAFTNAQSAKPCILFFDEFDALAPRRGHDSTGVTDRVVNQMLTQMDGVESLNGVYILAATSRPDLIDPALLRPGRLDKHLFCPLPDENDRLQILQALSQRLHLSEDVDLTSIASLTPDFSGADLQALLYSAQIESIHHSQDSYTEGKDAASKREDSLTKHEMIYLPSVEEGPVILDTEQEQRIRNEITIIQRNLRISEQIKPSDDENKPSFIYISHKHLVSALSKMRPSVSPAERTKYQLIYSRFGKGVDVSTTADFGRKRVTLA